MTYRWAEETRARLSICCNGLRKFGRAGRIAAVASMVAAGMVCGTAHAQSLPTASRIGDLQIGGGLVFGRSSYNFNASNLIGATFYTSFDRKILGFEADFHQVNPSSGQSVYERTYEIGARAHYVVGNMVPYGKFMIGRGVYNFPGNAANVAYNMYGYGGGADYRLLRSMNVRGDYEYQTWPGFPLGTLHPSVITVGVAFHFHE